MVPSAASTDQNAYPYDTERVRELLKHKRKVRGIRSCFPCRHRKDQIAALKADLRASTRTASPGSSPRPGVRTSKPPGRHFVEDATGATIFLGSHSDTPLALGCRQAATPGDAMVDHFVPRAYPFTNLWGSGAAVKEVCETLPDDSDTIRYWQTYQSTAYPFYPVLVTIEQFGASLFAFLDQRALAREATSRPEEPDSSWLALLFAVLACGVQFSDDPIKERDLRSKVFICSSFQCLRLSNFFNRPDLDQIQAMALIGHCLRNNLDTNSAWILMGATIRLAQSIGLHETSLSLPRAEQAQRNGLWWTLIWQDTFLSFTYDRPPSAVTMMNCPIPYTHRGGHSFPECIFTICDILLGRTRQESSSTSTPLQRSLDCKRQLEAVWDSAAPFLTDKSHCASLQDHLERLALGVHLGYGICRLSHDVLLLGDEASAADCMQSGLAAMESFLDLHRFSARVCRSWAFVHNAVSCAITLRGLETRRGGRNSNPRAEASVRRLIAVLEKEAKESEWCDADTNVRHFGPYSRELKALREIYLSENEV
ncbi:fungal-specific transcription factor domain-containing protein [Parachaetomium inaequale]|uniref:Fungal-specific transcription factor domain-containing protein n=1 Tax=Parachaetomium inaequale TaxID=2588326 RepID=A0AAN6SLI4_9PEZI|nr:fungal-specific transcription factor domain-containing protein [Parachaetomium inaequale]